MVTKGWLVDSGDRGGGLTGGTQRILRQPVLDHPVMADTYHYKSVKTPKVHRQGGTLM